MENIKNYEIECESEFNTLIPLYFTSGIFLPGLTAMWGIYYIIQKK